MRLLALALHLVVDRLLTRGQQLRDAQPGVVAQRIERRTHWRQNRILAVIAVVEDARRRSALRGGELEPVEGAPPHGRLIPPPRLRAHHQPVDRHADCRAGQGRAEVEREGDALAPCHGGTGLSGR